MADQENPETTDSEQEAGAPEEAAPEQAAPEAAADAPASEPEAAAEEAAPEPAAEEPVAEEPVAPTPGPSPATPKERKVAARARRGTRRPATPEARDELRREKATSRTRRRASEKAKRSGAEKGEGTPRAEPGPGAPKVRLGRVVSDKADKTITVRIDVARRHRRYQKIVRSSSTLHAHDESNDANEGDLVRVVESRPMSRTKRWRLVEVLERAK
jgi:small subunit ribosomal protein S17